MRRDLLLLLGGTLTGALIGPSWRTERLVMPSRQRLGSARSWHSGGGIGVVLLVVP